MTGVDKLQNTLTIFEPYKGHGINYINVWHVIEMTYPVSAQTVRTKEHNSGYHVVNASCRVTYLVLNLDIGILFSE